MPIIQCTTPWHTACLTVRDSNSAYRRQVTTRSEQNSVLQTLHGPTSNTSHTTNNIQHNVSTWNYTRKSIWTTAAINTFLYLIRMTTFSDVGKCFAPRILGWCRQANPYLKFGGFTCTDIYKHTSKPNDQERATKPRQPRYFPNNISLTWPAASFWTTT